MPAFGVRHAIAPIPIINRRIDIERPRNWKSRIEPKFLGYMTEIREIFEAQGVLSKQ